MKKTTIAMVAAAVALLTAATATASSSPTIRFAGLTPAKARGAHFGAQEQIRVTLWAGAAKRLRTTHASALGTFTVDFGTLADKDRCSGSISLLAVGARGHTARYKLPAMACPMMTAGPGR